MPANRPCAAFEPIAPDLDIKALVQSTPNFEFVVRIHCDMIEHQGLENFEKLVLIHVIVGGKPLVIEGYENRLDRWAFTSQWLRDNVGSKVENARELAPKKENVPMTIKHYLDHLALLTNQWNSFNYKDDKRQRMYLKDIDCPPIWAEKVKDIVPPALWYLNDSTGDPGGFGAVDEADAGGVGPRKSKGVGKAGDLMSSLPKEMQAENLMCYIGHEGTYTPAHREMCASLGQNIMVEASSGKVEDGKPTKPGSSIWFMTQTKDRKIVSEYWLSKLGHDIEIEKHFAQVNAWRNAPFNVYVVEQKPGDFILIPPLAPHQVWNRGTRTMKVAWNRTTIETLELAVHEALPNSRMVCRDEQYKNKAIIYFTMQKYSRLLRIAEKVRQKQQGSKHRQSNDLKARQLEKDFRRLHALYTEILVDESFFQNSSDKKVELVPFDSNITCSYCRCNIFNRFLTCPSCVVDLADGEKDTYDICMECYAMGRSCACISKLRWVEQFPWGELTQRHEQWRHQILQLEGQITEKSPKSLKYELEKRGRKRTLAQICQLELIRRPFKDPTKQVVDLEEDGVEREEEVEVDANGNLKKKKKIRRSEKFMRDNGRCHVDCYWEPSWKQATCSKCDKNYCYGNLFRAYDMMPRDVMEDPEWKCPSCLKICGCRHCSKRPGYKLYTPKGTLLGHNTKAVADPRSVESLVDFSHSNISWIQKAGDDNGADTLRMKRHRRKADADKAVEPELGEDYVDEDTLMRDDNVEEGILMLAQQEGIPIDPALVTSSLQNPPEPRDEDEYHEHPELARVDDQLTSGLPLAPQYVVPEGGVIRDKQHEYDQIEAITYDYPDPNATFQVPLPGENVPAALPNGYGPAVPSENDNIEMIERKRKRKAPDEGDQPYGYKKPKHKPTKRPSMVVTLRVNKEKLAEFQRMAIIAQRALAAPVIGSDLEALKAHKPRADGEAPLQRKDVDDLREDDVDDEFTPGRYRDRRKPRPDGMPLPQPDSDITRRQTRMQMVTYEEPEDEEEFNEVVEKRPQVPVKSKLATMTQIDLDAVADLEDEEDSPPPVSTMSKSQLRPSASSSTLTPNANGVSHNIPSHSGLKPRSNPSSTPQSSLRPLPASSTETERNLAATTATAIANRRAKMQAIEQLDDDDADLEDDWSEAESPPVQPSTPVAVTKPQAAPPKQTPAPVSVSPVSSNKHYPTISIQKPSVPSKIATQDKPKPRPPVPAPHPAKAVTAKTASASAWADSDSDDDEVYAVKPLHSAWTSVNGNSSGHVKDTTTSNLPSGKKKGRPPGGKLVNGKYIR